MNNEIQLVEETHVLLKALGFSYEGAGEYENPKNGETATLAVLPGGKAVHVEFREYGELKPYAEIYHANEIWTVGEQHPDEAEVGLIVTTYTNPSDVLQHLHGFPQIELCNHD